MEMSLGKGKQLTRKTMRLKDYLLDELSSCSSNGFRSYPRRRQCCTTVRLLVELDLKKKPPKKPILKKPSKSSSISALQRASNALINAVKHLPFTSSASTLPRKLLKRCFSKKNENAEIPIGNAIEKKSSSQEISITGSNSSSSMSESNGESYSWSGSDFTVSDEFLRCSSVNSEVKNLNKITKASSVENNGQVNHKIAAAIVGGDDSVEAATTDSNRSSSTQKNEEEKEQFSPVSVLDRPFEDDEDEVSSPFQPRIARAKAGSKKRQMRNTIKKLDRLTKLEPIKLEKRIALSESDQDSSASPLYASSQSNPEDAEESTECKVEDEENNSDIKAFQLLQLIRSATILASAEKLLLDFFKEEIEIGQHTPMGLTCGVVCDNELLNKANDWLKGQPRELVLEGEVKKSMEACLRYMEREGKWRRWDEEIKEMVLELEAEVFASLVDEVLYDH